MLLTACGASDGPDQHPTQVLNSAQSAPVERGWREGRDAYRNFIHYLWADAARTILGGSCHSGPVFVLINGDYPSEVYKFELQIDDQRSELDTSEFAHGRALIVDDPALVERIIQAEERITFRVGGWSRDLRPDPVLRKFASECTAMRKVDPDADGRRG